MKLTAPLLALALLPTIAYAVPKPALTSASPIIAVPTNDGCDITLPPGDVTAVNDRMYLVIDGNSEQLVGYYLPDAHTHPKSIHYLASASSDMDNQVKSILTAQGFPIKPDVTTYHVTAGIGFPSTNGFVPGVVTLSRTLHFAHASGNSVNMLARTNKLSYNIGDKIPVFDTAIIDSSITFQDALGPNDITSGKLVSLAPGLLHRITVQVQFVPKTTP